MCIICDGEDLTGLQELYCSDCPQITNIPYIDGLQFLYCYNCPLLYNISEINGLHILDCDQCPLLADIPHINSLQILDCSNCPLLTNIPLINDLRTLDCSGCPLLTTIPNTNNLSTLDCSYCRSFTELFDTSIRYVEKTGCVWLSSDPNFEQSMKKLIFLQQWFRRMGLSLRLKKLIPLIVPLYYHPAARGGYLDKLEILKCFQDF
jgi:hypothetical protein